MKIVFASVTCLLLAATTAFEFTSRNSNRLSGKVLQTVEISDIFAEGLTLTFTNEENPVLRCGGFFISGLRGISSSECMQNFQGTVSCTQAGIPDAKMYANMVHRYEHVALMQLKGDFYVNYEFIAQTATGYLNQAQCNYAKAVQRCQRTGTIFLRDVFTYINDTPFIKTRPMKTVPLEMNPIHGDALIWEKKLIGIFHGTEGDMSIYAQIFDIDMMINSGPSTS